MLSLLAVAVAIGTVSGQIYNPSTNLVASGPVAFEDSPPPVDPVSLQHREVVLNANLESQLPPELRNPFYKNPRIAAGLAKESWLANKEFPVFHRDTQDIERKQIAKLIKNAGFAKRR